MECVLQTTTVQKERRKPTKELVTLDRLGGGGGVGGGGGGKEFGCASPIGSWSAVNFL